jgi:hypothetical protein
MQADGPAILSLPFAIFMRFVVFRLAASGVARSTIVGHPNAPCAPLRRVQKRLGQLG